ncbi:CopD family protein [Gracilibacillus sp. S3-1-1]|uniref:CopD family protein n=1 Tax=Gracilibacillus pellucidus TaxID=3095368 RepID=A0ACC6M787_9BACI|nr:CopD family protein [Gracilibacillus sp. S3-1-1]MDX8046839.1 CopD family protein [Gracilibacillus sp. S3-1-1]
MIAQVSNGLLYICFAVVMGACILGLIPEDKKTSITMPKKIVALAITLIPVLSFLSLLDLAITLNPYREESFLATTGHVILHIANGHAWVALAILAIIFLILFVVLREKKVLPLLYGIGLLLAFGMLVTQTVVGHAANMGSYPGALAHLFHYIAVTAWMGVLFITSWFSKNDNNWQAFLGWFTPFAIGCVSILALSGMFMSYFLNEDLVASWTLPYGQALLVKCLLFIPILFFAFINSVLVRKRVKEDVQYSPRSWWRAESVIILVVLAVTAIMTEQEPPHNIAQTLVQGESSILFQTFASVPAGTNVIFAFNGLSVLFLAVGLLFLGCILYSFLQKLSPYISLVMTGLAVVSIYIGLMSGVTV